MFGARDVDRYVLPVGEATPLDADGFLTLPSGDWWTDSAAQPRAVTDLVGDGGSVVLLAAGGAGKTTVFGWLRSREAGSREVNLLGLDRRAIRESLSEAIDVGDVIYVDALDQVALREPAIFDILGRVLAEDNARRVAWRLSCRPVAWSPLLGSVLRRLGFQELRLLPLTRAAVRDVVTDDVAEPDRFVDAIVRAHLGRLSASPMQLRRTARHWQGTGRLPESHAESIRFETVRLLSEQNPAFPLPELAADRRFRLAGRLGAISVFCGVAAFATTAGPMGGTVPVQDLPSTPEPDEPGTRISPVQLATVLNSALFEAAPDAAVMFRHQQYAEYLAADYLCQRRITRAQLPALFGTIDGLLPGPLVGVAAWLAALRPDLVRDLLDANALAFARSGIELAQPARVRVVDGLIAAAAAGDLDAEWGLDLSSLAHPGLEAQLASHFEVVRHPAQMWWLAQLAHAGRCAGLVGKLLRLALDPTWPAWACRAAITAIDALGDDDDRLALKALLRLDQAADPDDELLAGAIDALYPALMATDELLDVLRPRRNDHLVGGYLVLLGELVERVPLRDLAVVLDWAAQRSHGDDSEHDYGRLIGQLIVRGWHNVGQPRVRDSLAALLAALAGPPNWGLGDHLDTAPWSDDGVGPEQRRSLAVAVAERLNDETWDQPLQMGLLLRADADWLLDELPNAPRPAQQTLANCVVPLLDQATAAQVDRVLSLPPTHPAYEPTRWWRDPIPIASTLADQLRRSHRRQQRDQSTHLAAVAARQAERLSTALAAATTDVATWWQIAYWLAGGDTPGETVFTHDLTTRPGWAMLSTEERQRVLDLGAQYLGQHDPQPSNWLGKQSITPTVVLPDWSGVYLMTTLVRHNPARLHTLAPATWEAWAPAIVGAWNFDRNADARLRCDLVDLAPASARARIVADARTHLDALAVNDRTLTPSPLIDHLCEELAPHIVDRLTHERYGAQLSRSLLDLLANCSPATAVDVCRRLCETPASSLTTVARRKLAELDPALTVQMLVAADPTPDEVAAIVPRIRLPNLDDANLEAICRLLLETFPISDDPPIEAWAYESPDEARHVRNRAAQLLGERGQVRRLERLASGRPEIDRAMIGYHTRAARTRAADLAYAHPEPHELIALLDRADARLVRHNSGLMSVIIEQLTEIQHDLAVGGFRDLWNTIDGHEPVPKSEDDITDWVRRQLQTRLGNGSIVDREIQVQRKKPGGVGTRIDLTATTPTVTHPIRTARVIAEAKLVNNRSLPTALTDQLVQRYLKPAGLHHGIYLVYWVNPQQRPASWTRKGPTNQRDLLRRLKNQVNLLDDLEIELFLLDISRPSSLT